MLVVQYPHCLCCFWKRFLPFQSLMNEPEILFIPHDQWHHIQEENNMFFHEKSSSKETYIIRPISNQRINVIIHMEYGWIIPHNNNTAVQWFDTKVQSNQLVDMSNNAITINPNQSSLHPSRPHHVGTNMLMAGMPTADKYIGIPEHEPLFCYLSTNDLMSIYFFYHVFVERPSITSRTSGRKISNSGHLRLIHSWYIV